MEQDKGPRPVPPSHLSLPPASGFMPGLGTPQGPFPSGDTKSMGQDDSKEDVLILGCESQRFSSTPSIFYSLKKNQVSKRVIHFTFSRRYTMCRWLSYTLAIQEPSRMTKCPLSKRFYSRKEFKNVTHMRTRTHTHTQGHYRH